MTETDGHKYVEWDEAQEICNLFVDDGLCTASDIGCTSVNLIGKAVKYYDKYVSDTDDATTKEENQVIENYCQAYDFMLNTDKHVLYIAMSNFRAVEWLATYSAYSKTDTKTFDYCAGEVLTKYFTRLREYYVSDKLAGVILDNRRNFGGYNCDLEYFIGLYIKNPITVGYSKHKEGFGKLDYSSEMPDIIYPKNSLDYCDLESKNIPYVVLCDLNTVSNGEVSASAVQAMPNGWVIGERTMGATGSLLASPELLFYTYGGTFGDMEKGPVYVYTSTFNTRFFTDNGYESLEGKGVTPDKTINFESSGEDNLIKDVQSMLVKQTKEAFDYIINHQESN